MRGFIKLRILLCILTFSACGSICNLAFGEKLILGSSLSNEYYVRDINLRNQLAAINFFRLVTVARSETIEKLNLPKKLNFSEPLEMSTRDVELLLENTNWMIRLHCGGQPVSSEIIKGKGHFDGIHKPEMNFLFQSGRLYRSTPKINSLDRQMVESIDQSVLVSDVTKYALYFQYGSSNSYVIDYLNTFFDEEIRVYRILETDEYVIEESLKSDTYYCEKGEPVRKLLVSTPMS